MPQRTSKSVLNFGAGPAKLPEIVLKDIQDDLLNWNGTGMSIMEVSHRSSEFGHVMNSLRQNLLSILGLEQNRFTVLLMPGGGTLQFGAIPMNLANSEADEGLVVDYIISGSWSHKAAMEAQRLLNPRVRVNCILIKNEQDDGTWTIADPRKWSLSPPGKACYVYYCDNETIEGIEFPSSNYVAEELARRGIEAPLVSDMSSNFLSRPIQMNLFGLVFATAQKNLGPAGVTIVVIRNDLLKRPKRDVPLMMDYALFAQHESLFNTPPVFAIYVTDLVLKWILDQGTENLYDTNERKANLLYAYIDTQTKNLICPVPNAFRSRMNIVFKAGNASGDLLVRLEKMAKDNGVIGISGHRSFGGLRVSLYNSITEEEVQQLITIFQKVY